jgi:L-amino acid N-acyltransferase
VAGWREPASVLRAARGWVSASADKAAADGHAFYVAVAGGQVIGLVTVCELAHFTGQVDVYVGELVEMVKPVAART